MNALLQPFTIIRGIITNSTPISTRLITTTVRLAVVTSIITQPQRPRLTSQEQSMLIVLLCNGVPAAGGMSAPAALVAPGGGGGGPACLNHTLHITHTHASV